MRSTTRGIVAVALVGTLGLLGCNPPAPSSQPDSGTPDSGTPDAGPPPAATRLHYVNPESTGWRLEEDASSTATHLVLNLVGPSEQQGRGVAVTLRTDEAKARWSKLGSAYFEDLNVFQLVMDPLNAIEPRLAVGGVRGPDLSVGIFQKDATLEPKALGVPLLRVAMDLRTEAGLVAGSPVPLTVTKATLLPADLSKAQLENVEVAVGTLEAR